MLPSHIDDFARGCLTDNQMAALSLGAGETVGLEEVVHLGAEAQAVHMLVALSCRILERIEQCKRLWTKAYEFYDAACQIWAQAPQDGELLATHRALLTHLRETAHDRVEFYAVSPAERSNYCSRKVDEKVGASITDELSPENPY